MHPILPRLALALLLTTAATPPICTASQATLDVAVNQPGARVAPTLWGIFFEDINLSADGGIYPELVRNRSFEDDEIPAHWRVLQADDGKTEISIDSRRPLNPMNRRNLHVEIHGPASLVNEGYWGMNIVSGQSYTASLSARAANGFQGPLKLALLRADGSPLAQTTVNRLGEDWSDHSVTLTASGSDPKARLHITLEGHGDLWLDMVSVLPQNTWKGHGLRPDLCQMLADLQPSFFRFPGGCWVEGDDLAHMYHWKNTLGDIAHRPPLWNIWQYWATHGLGYHEYLQLSEDLGAEPLFCINVGMSHREVVPLDQMGPWVQDALDAIEYANGSTNTVWGRLRAQNGHPEPFHLRYLEIGNENGGPAYHERWALFHQAIKARYPDIQLVANVWGGYPTTLAPDIIDEHYYNNPEFFMLQADKYDTYDRNGPKVFVGEYAVTSGAGLGNLRGAIGEAAFMTGMERNSDVVIMASYAPLLVNANHKRWPINLINFDSSRAFGLPSYYVQKLFSEHRGDVVLPVTLAAPTVDQRPLGGSVGVGTWLTEAEFKDIRVTRNGVTLLAADFADGTAGWNLLGNGDWSAVNGSLRQASRAENVRAIIGDHNWTDYTYSLKARKVAGAEGFLVLFANQRNGEKSWWNLGGWGNSRHAVEMGGIIGNEVSGSIETGRWYDIRIELKGSNIKCYLDGTLVHDIQQPQLRSLYASATRVDRTGEIIVKVVNVAQQSVPATLCLKGAGQLRGPAQKIVLTSEHSTDENTLDNPSKVAPRSSAQQVNGPEIQQEFPPNSLTVLRIPTR